MDGPGGAVPQRSAASRPRVRRRASVAGVLGEVLITAGVVVLLYVSWQLWVGDWIMGAQKNADGQELSQEWAAQGPDATSDDPAPTAPSPTASAPAEPAPTDSPADPVAMRQPGNGQVFGIMRIPRFGADYAVKIAGGVTRAGTLDHIGIGHYPGTDMPGDVGNVALAAHRTTFGAPFARIAELHVGDAIVIETKAGWYTYRFRTLEYVKPTAVDVLQPVPQASASIDGGRYLTMTSCSPKHSLAERIVGYSVFESFQPRAAGAPSSLMPVAGA